MRHFLLSCAVRTRPLGMFAATSMTRLVASASLALRIASRRLSAFLLAVDVAAIAAAADQHLSAAARAQKESPSCICLSGFVAQTWTKSATGGILPRHTCSARCGARRRYDLRGWDRRRACPQRGQGFSAPSPALGVATSPEASAERRGRPYAQPNSKKLILPRKGKFAASSGRHQNSSHQMSTPEKDGSWQPSTG